MSEHLPESLIGSEVLSWCRVCKKETRHRVDRVAVGSHAGKAGPCMEHGPKEKPERKPETMPAPLGAKEWAVYWLQSNELRPSELRITDFVNGPDARIFFASKPRGTATLWRLRGANYERTQP